MTCIKYFLSFILWLIRKVKVGIKCMSDYVAQCLTGTPKTVLRMILTNVEIHLDNRCNNSDHRREFIEHVKCFNPREKMQPLNECNDKHTVMMELIKDMDRDDQTPALCCSLRKLQECIVTKSKMICGESSSQYWDETFQEVVSFL
jgi:hypothetical protein